jgi:hypothetical protein
MVYDKRVDGSELSFMSSDIVVVSDWVVGK